MIARTLPLLMTVFCVCGTAAFAQSAPPQSFVPADPSAAGGGNPLQGLGRPDDPGAQRYGIPDPSASQGNSFGGAQFGAPGALQPPGQSMFGQDQGASPGSPSAAQAALFQFASQLGGTAGGANSATGALAPQQPASPYGQAFTQAQTSATAGNADPSGSSTGRDDAAQNPKWDPAIIMYGTERKTAAADSTPAAEPAKGSPGPGGLPPGVNPPGISGASANAKTAGPDTASDTASSADTGDTADSDVPPPPRPVSSTNGKSDTPIRRALADVRSGRYSDAMVGLNRILAKNPGDAQAHYLKAVLLVFGRQYVEASGEYQQVIKTAPNSDIARLAQAGLSKLGH